MLTTIIISLAAVAIGIGVWLAFARTRLTKSSPPKDFPSTSRETNLDAVAPQHRESAGEPQLRREGQSSPPARAASVGSIAPTNPIEPPTDLRLILQPASTNNRDASSDAGLLAENEPSAVIKEEAPASISAYNSSPTDSSIQQNITVAPETPQNAFREEISPPQYANGEAAAAVTAVQKPQAAEHETPVQLGVYRPPRVAPPSRTRSRTKSEPRTVQRDGSQDNPLEICIQAIFDRYGFCELRVLGQRMEDGEQELNAKSGRETVTLSAYGDFWYQIQLETDLATILSHGILLSARTADGNHLRWQLKGRDVYVLSGRHGFAGYASAKWLKTGRADQIVLCKIERQQEAAAILEQAGCGQLEPHGEDFGAPPGWVFFRAVKPVRSLPLPSPQDILNILRPLPQIEIALDGGLCLRNSVWLSGYPPKINISGDLPSHAAVTIDGHQAERQEDGSYAVPGWDQDGDHFVWCGGQQVNYSIDTPAPGWQPWESYSYASGTVCGAISAPRASKLITVPVTNPVLVGAEPGQVFRCPPRACKEWTGFVSFDPVWALPEDSHRNSHQALLLNSEPPSAPGKTIPLRNKKLLAVKKWCRAILCCSRKEFLPANSEEEKLWRHYISAARQTRRSVKQHGTK